MEHVTEDSGVLPASREDRGDAERTAFPDLVVLGQETWGPLARRNRLLIEALASAHPGSRFLFSETPLRPRALLSERVPPVRQIAENIWTLRPARPFPSAASARLSDQVEAWQIRRAMAQVGLRRPALWSQDPRSVDLIGTLGTRGFIYDLTDDWEAFQPDEASRSTVAGQVRELLGLADVVLACSAYLERYAAERGASSTLVPNAAGDMSGAANAHPALAELPTPRLGYLGTLHEARLDIDLLIDTARLRPAWSVVLVGPSHLGPEATARLAQEPNIHLLGAGSYEEVPAYLKGFSVGLVPHLVNPVSESLDPLKFYEYAAAGLAIVATPVGIPPEIADLVTPADSAEAIVAAVERVAPETPGAPAVTPRRLGWAERAERVSAALQDSETLNRSPGDDSAAQVSAAIVSYNTREMTLAAIASVQAQTPPPGEIICVDNASHDASVAAIRAHAPDVVLISSETNLGFGPANNLAFTQAHGEWVLLVNSDAVMAPDALSRLLDAARRHPEAAVLGPRLLNGDGSLQRSAWPFPTPLRMLVEAAGLHRILRRTPWWEDLGTWEHDAERPVDFLVGACLLARRAVLARVGGFDESFPLYAEEADLLYRIHRLGWSTVFVPDAVVTHLGGGSSTVEATRARLFHGAQLRYVQKHFGAAGLALGRAALVLSALLRRRWALIPIAFQALPDVLESQPAAVGGARP